MSMQRIPWWHGKGVPPTPNRQSRAALVIAIAAILLVIASLVTVLLGGPPSVLGVAMLVLVVALPAALSLHRRQR
jgi:hypothetical protein